MQKKIINYISILSIEFFVLFSLLFILPSIITEKNSYSKIYGSNKLHLNNKKYTNNFKLDKNNFNSLSLNFQNPGLMGHDEIEINLIQDPEVINKFITSGYSINDGGWINFKFNPILNSKNVDYKIEVVCLNKCENLFLTGEKENFNLKTTSKYNLKDSFLINLKNQKEKILNNDNKIVFWFLIIIFLNILLIITL